MATEKKDPQKHHGVFYTPQNLADLLVRKVITSPRMSVLDPACGEGQLLSRAAAISLEKFGISGVASLQGLDRDGNLAKALNRLGASFQKGDFISSAIEKKYDTILMNPPFVRHQRFTHKREGYLKTIEPIVSLHPYSDLWAYFLVKATAHLMNNGAIASVLPWSFLQARYARRIRTFLSSSFSKITVLMIGDELFDEARERVLLVWLDGFGGKAKDIEIGYISSVDDPLPEFQTIPLHVWDREKVTFAPLKGQEVEGLLDQCKEQYGFAELSQFARVTSGIVTGANDFFIVQHRAIFPKDIIKTSLVPILNSTSELNTLHLNGEAPQSWLVNIQKGQYSLFVNFLRKGKRENLHKRTYLMGREPWYRVHVGEIPDAFIHYRTSRIPFLVLNNNRMYATNSIHRVYFNGLSEQEKKWLQITLLSSIGQLSLELRAKNYGTHVLKLEPKSVGKAIVLTRKDEVNEPLYRELSNLVTQKKFSQVTRLADEAVYRNFGVSKELLGECRGVLSELRARRGIRDDGDKK